MSPNIDRNATKIYSMPPSKNCTKIYAASQSTHATLLRATLTC